MTNEEKTKVCTDGWIEYFKGPDPHTMDEAWAAVYDAVAESVMKTMVMTANELRALQGLEPIRAEDDPMLPAKSWKPGREFI